MAGEVTPGSASLSGPSQRAQLQENLLRTLIKLLKEATHASTHLSLFPLLAHLLEVLATELIGAS